MEDKKTNIWLAPFRFLIKVLYGPRKEIKSGFINSSKGQEQFMYDALRWFGLFCPIFLIYLFFISPPLGTPAEYEALGKNYPDFRMGLGAIFGVWLLVRIAQNAHSD